MESFPAGGGPTPARGEARRARGVRRPPGFAKGALVGLIVLIPAVAAAVVAFARGARTEVIPGMIEALRLTAVFAGLPAVLTAGGVGRLAGQASVAGGRRGGIWAGARTLAVAGGALVVIAAVACQVIPGSRPGWVALIAAGMVGGALAGALVGLACGGPLPTLGDLGVWPGDVNLTEAVERVVGRAIGRRHDSEPPAPDGS